MQSVRYAYTDRDSNSSDELQHVPGCELVSRVCHGRLVPMYALAEEKAALQEERPQAERDLWFALESTIAAQGRVSGRSIEQAGNAARATECLWYTGDPLKHYSL